MAELQENQHVRISVFLQVPTVPTQAQFPILLIHSIVPAGQAVVAPPWWVVLKLYNCYQSYWYFFQMCFCRKVQVLICKQVCVCRKVQIGARKVLLKKCRIKVCFCRQEQLHFCRRKEGTGFYIAFNSIGHITTKSLAVPLMLMTNSCTNSPLRGY